MERDGGSDKPEAPPPEGGVPDARTLRALLSVLDDFTVQRDESDLLRSMLERVSLAMEASRGAIFVSDGEEEPISCGFAKDDPDPWSSFHALEQEARTAGPLVRRGPSGGWVAATPLVSQGRQLGVVCLEDTRGTISPAHELLSALGQQMGTGLASVRLYAEVRAAMARAEALHRITASLASNTDVRVAVPAFAGELATFQRFDRLACGFVNDSGDYLEVISVPEGMTWGFGPVLPLVGTGPGSVIVKREAFVARDLLQSRRFIEDLRLLEEGLRSYVLLPLFARGRAIGVLALGSRRAGAFDETTAHNLGPVAEAAALALDNLRLLQKTRELSITDDVTPLYNFRFFHQILERELKLVDRYHSVLSLIFLDLDNFKPINDQYGHLRGSRVLREVGFLIRAAVRETDYAARYGGDEFVVILPQTEGSAARVLGEKLRRLIQDHVFLQEEGISARIGLSFGVATYPADAASKEELIRLADGRMYADKDSRKENA